MNVKKNLKLVAIVLFAMLIFSVILVIVLYLNAYAHFREPLSRACGSGNYHSNEISPPRNAFNRFIYDNSVFKPFCGWIWQRREKASLKEAYLPRTLNMEAVYIADFSDDNILIGASHNIFVGKVIKQVSVTEIGSPETQFEVVVTYNIKGDLNDRVMVNQYGGYRNGILYVMESDDLLLPNSQENYLLKLGNTYLFATRYNPKKNWYTLSSHPNGRKTISTNPNLSKSQLEDLARNDPKVQALQEAYKNEILLDADVYHNNTRNSYKSLHPEAETKE